MNDAISLVCLRAMFERLGRCISMDGSYALLAFSSCSFSTCSAHSTRSTCPLFYLLVLFLNIKTEGASWGTM